MRGEADLSNTYYNIRDSAGKHRDILKDISKHTYLVHGSVNSSDECKVLGYLDLCVLKSGLIRTMGMITQLERNLINNKRTIILLIMQWIK